MSIFQEPAEIPRQTRGGRLCREIFTVFGIQYEMLWINSSLKTPEFLCLRGGEWVRRVELVMPYPTNEFYPAPPTAKQKEIAEALEQAAEAKYTDGFKVALDVISWD